MQPLVQTLVDESSALDGEVYLVNGDRHVYSSDPPLEAGQLWLATYGATGSADDLQRITVDLTNNTNDRLKVTVSRPVADRVLSRELIPCTS